MNTSVYCHATQFLSVRITGWISLRVNTPLRCELQQQAVLDTPRKSAYLTVARGNDVELSRIIYFYMINPRLHDSCCSVPSSKVSSPLPIRPTTCWQLLHQHTFTDKSHWRLLPLYFGNRIAVAFRRRYAVSAHTVLQWISYACIASTHSVLYSSFSR